MKGRATREFLSSARIRCCPHRIQTEDSSIKGLKKKKKSLVFDCLKSLDASPFLGWLRQ